MSLHIEPNSEPIPGYRLIERIGQGGFGEVWKAEAPGGLHKAIKIIHGDLRSVDADGCRHAEQELRALKRLQGIRHPYLLSLERYDVVEGRVLIVSELADCNMWDRFKEARAQQRPGIPRGELIRYLEEAAEVLDLMNTQYQLQHLDIKPQNLFLVYNHVKVADFGLVKDLEGVKGQITGGVTPVYAAPETFDNVVTRFCDQYSLAIVYQELLTGVRPFNGTSGQQLLIQHLREPPNLGPLPPADRPVVGRALSKKPEDRFPNCIAFVRALQQAGTDTPPPPATPPGHAGRLETPVGVGRMVPPLPPLAAGPQPELLPPMETPKTQLKVPKPDSAAVVAIPPSSADVPLPARPAPPEVTGPGALVPAVVVGIGQLGLDVVREFRRLAQERFGMADRLPHLKVLFIDTDSETLHSATSGTAALEPTDVVPARLNRPAHYLKPRRNGRSLIEGWFDPQTLYKIPRAPATVGLRCLGRLAFLDHYRTFAEKLTAGLEACVHPDALTAADRATKLGIRSNRPRVYVVAGLGGGTGSGMYLDAAYAARHRLRQLGYTDPQVIGVLLLPAAERGAKGPGVSNAYSALRELNHYCQPDTVFSAEYEETTGHVTDHGPPFRRCVVLPLPPAPRPGVTETPRDVARKAADFLLGDLLSPLGRAADEARAALPKPAGELSVCAFGRAGFAWPRQMLLTRAARWLGATVLTRWTASDPDVIGQYVKGWLAQRWQAEQLGPEHLVAALQKAGEQALGQSPEALFQAEAQPFAAKGWFARNPDPATLWQAVAKLQQLVGMPDDRAVQRTVGKLEEKLDEAADALAREFAGKISRLATTLLEHPDYRLVGAEVVVEKAKEMIDGVLRQYEPTAGSLGTQAIDAFQQIHRYLSPDKGQRRPSAAEVAEALRSYPTWRYQSLVLRQVCRIYQTLKTHLGDQLRELEFCRQRLEDILQRLRKDTADAPPPAERLLLPAGVESLEAAVAGLEAAVTSEDLRAFDKQLQRQIEREFNALFNVCTSSVSMMGTLQETIEDQARAFLSGRLGSESVVQMFRGKFPSPEAAADALVRLHDVALPPVRLFGAEKAETVVLCGPDGEAGKQLRQLGEKALPTAPAAYVAAADEVSVYREFAHIRLTALPQLGPVGEDAYNAALDAQGASPHSRCDVPSWEDVEVS